MFDSNKARLLALMLLASGGSQAGDPSWVEELGTIDAQIQLLQKREELAVQRQTSSQRCLAGLPKVVAIYEFAGLRSAQLYYPSGQLHEVRPGTPLAVGAQVVDITPNSVQVRLNCDRQRPLVALEFTSLARRQSVQAQQNSNQTQTSDSMVTTQPGLVVGAPIIRLDTPLPPVPGTQGNGAR